MTRSSEAQEGECSSHNVHFATSNGALRIVSKTYGMSSNCWFDRSGVIFLWTDDAQTLQRATRSNCWKDYELGQSSFHRFGYCSIGTWNYPFSIWVAAGDNFVYAEVFSFPFSPSYSYDEKQSW